MANSIRWDREEFAPYLRHVADVLHLKDWRVEVMDEPTEAGAHASITCVYGRKYACVYLSEDFLRDSEEEQRHSAAHELIHAHLVGPDSIAQDELPEALKGIYRHAAEYAIDGLADAIAPLLPLPSEILDAVDMASTY